ncbi:MAG: hypothetical protein J6A89_05070 [Clostridia bacterium]|nr:hypothetical protein [Clostridia bacterium]
MSKVNHDTDVETYFENLCQEAKDTIVREYNKVRKRKRSKKGYTTYYFPIRKKYVNAVYNYLTNMGCDYVYLDFRHLEDKHFQNFIDRKIWVTIFVKSIEKKKHYLCITVYWELPPEH